MPQRKTLPSILIAAVILACLSMTPAREAGAAEAREPSREEWVRAVEAKIRERKKQQQLEQAPQDPRTPLGQVTPTPAVGDDSPPIPTSNAAVLYFEPPNVAILQNETFTTNLVLTAQRSRKFDSLDLMLHYDPEFLAPVSFHDDPLRELMSGDPFFHVDPEAGTLTYQAQLTRPLGVLKTRLASIVWHARKPVESTVARLRDDSKRSSVRLKGKDLLAGEFVPEGLLLPLQAQILSGDSNPRDSFLATSRAFVEALPGSEQGPIWLEMLTPRGRLSPGDEIDVRIALRNPAGVSFDEVSLLMQFPPDRFEVLDWDRGNWIRTGVNVHDGDFHEAFPFDFHQANSVDGRRGRIVYRMGSLKQVLQSSGALAQMRLRALAPAEPRDIQFVIDPDSRETTDVKLVGVSRLTGPPASLPDAGSSP